MELEESTCLTSDYTTKLQDSMVLAQDRNIDQWNKIGSSDKSIYLIFDKGEKTISLKSGGGKTGQPLVKE